MVTERVYTIPLRKGFKLTARHKKTKKAVTILKEFLARHMRTDLKNVYIGRNLNKEMWKHGIKNPPGKVKVVVIKEDNGDVKAELFGFKYEHKKKAEKEAEKEKKSVKEKKDSSIEEKAKDAKKKSTGSEEKHEHVHVEGHEHNHEHKTEEKHEHAASHTHEHPKPAVKKTAPKKASKKAE